MPLASGASSREPVFIQTPMEMERIWRISSLSTSRPFGRSSRWMSRASFTRLGVFDAVFVIAQPYMILTCRKWSLGYLYVICFLLISRNPVLPSLLYFGVDKMASRASRMPESRQNGLLGLDIQELSQLALRYGQPEYRARQLFDAIYPQRRGSLDSISTLPKPFVSALKSEGVEIGLPTIEKRFQSSDGTIRYLLAMADGETVETVWMPEGDGGEAGDGSEAGDNDWQRATVCISSQVGCAVNCQFCL